MLQRLAWLFKGLFRRRRVEADLDEELHSSFEMIVDRFTAAGMSPAEARRAARMEFEGLDQVKETVRDNLLASSSHAFFQDVRYAWRGLRRRPWIASIALLMLALGIGVNTAVFSMYYRVLLQPLPYDHPEKLALIWTSFRTAGHGRAPVSGAILGEIEHRNRSLAGVAGIWTITRTFTGDEPEQVKCARVTANFFDVLGVPAAFGRTFSNGDRGGPAIILTNGFFRRRFLGDASLLGHGLPMAQANTLVGVLPRDFQLQFAPDSNVPADVQVFDTFDAGIYNGRNQYYIRVVARLKPGVSMTEAQRDLDRVAKEIAGAYTEYASEDLRFTLAGMQSDAVRDVKPALGALFAGSAFVLLICCVNVASLLLARASERRREIAMRLSLGASRARILRQLFVEGGLLSLLGGTAGLAVGWAGFRGLMAMRPERLSRVTDTGIPGPALVLAAACSLAAALLFGFIPGIDSLRFDLAALRAGGRGSSSRLHRRVGGMLVVWEITLGFMLVTGAALCTRTLSKIEGVAPGFEPQNLLAFQIANGMPGAAVAEWESQLASLPGVALEGATSHLPLDTDIPNWYSPYRPEGIGESEAATLISDLRCVTPGYFAAIGARLLEGRYFDISDRAGGRQVVIVDDLLARTTWPGESAVGKKVVAEHVTANGFEPISSVVVGVVEHLHNHSLTREVRGQIYLPFEQSRRSPLTFVLRTRVPPLSLVPSVRKALHDRSKTAAMAKIRPMTEYVAREISPVSFTAMLAAIFAGLALLLAATGIYGVFHYRVSQRRAEMGIRMALGASGGEVLRMVLREGFVLAAAGVMLGSVGAILAARWLAALLYGVGPLDPFSYLLALALLPAAAMLGCLRPAWRAASASPAEVIREE